MLMWLNKMMLKFRLRNFLYLILLNFFMFSTLTPVLEKSYPANRPIDFTTISPAENYSILITTNLKKVERLNLEQSSEYKTIHYSKYFFVESRFLPQNINFLYAINIQDIITLHELSYNSLELRSPPRSTT